MALDLNGITWGQVLVASMIVAAVDTATGILGAIGGHTFRWSFVADFLTTHVLSRIIPITGAALLSVELGGTPGGDAVFGVALFGLGAYIVQTIPSVGSNLALGSLSLPSMPTVTVSRKRKATPPAQAAPAVVVTDAPTDPGTPSGPA